MTIKQCLFCLLLLFSLFSCTEASPAIPTTSVSAATTVPTQTPVPTATMTAQSLAELGPYAVGTRDMTFVDEARQAQEIIITLWYPTTEAGQDAAPDLSGAPYPVVIYSHGGYYDGSSHRNAHDGLARHLASHGFVVVGLEHNDVDKAEAFVDRPLDILFVINQLDGLAESEWAGVLDMEKLGVMGMSQGTATTLQMGGARLDWEFHDAWCVAHPGSYLCPPDPSIPERGRALMAEVGVIDENGLGYILTDPRIHAIAAMSPGFAPMFGERGLKGVPVPVLLMAGTNDSYYEEEIVAIYYPYLGVTNRYLVSFIGYGHRDLFPPDSHRDLLMTAFFGQYLQGRQDYAQFLTEAYVNSLPGLAWGVYDVGDNTESAAAGRDVITIENVDQVMEEVVLEGEDENTVFNLVFSPDGTTLAIGSETPYRWDATVRLWDMDSGTHRILLPEHGNAVRSVAFSPDGTLLASGSQDGTARLWDAQTGQRLCTLRRDGPPAGLTCADDNGEAVWPNLPRNAVWSVAFSPDGATLAVGRGDPWAGPGSLQLYDVATGELLLEFEPEVSHSYFKMPTTFDLAFSPDGTLLATANGDGSVRLWDTTTGQERSFLGQHTASARSVAFSPDGTLLASGGIWSDCGWNEGTCRPEEEHGEIGLWDVATGEQLALFEGHLGGVEAIVFSGDGRFLVSLVYVDNTILFWDLATREVAATLELPADGVVDMRFSPDGTILATSGYDGAIRLWGIPTPPETTE